MTSNVVSIAERREAMRPRPRTCSTCVLVLNPMFWLCVWGGIVLAVTLEALEQWSAR